MTRETADTLWGPDAVEHALSHEHPEPVTDELAREIERRAAKTLTQPWPRFCAICASSQERRLARGVRR